jgi:hypothetical protein
VRLLQCPWLFLALAGVAGCGSGLKLYPVHGKVVYPDGSPMKGGAVIFEPVDSSVKVSARGYIDNEDGTFALTTVKAGDGAPAGPYRVMVRGKVIPHGRGADPEAIKTWEPQVHPRFQDLATSGLEFTVEPKKNEFVITVEKPSGSRAHR